MFNFTFKAGILRRRGYAFFSWCKSWVLCKKSKTSKAASSYMPPHRVCYSKVITHLSILDSSFAAWQNWPYSHTAVRNSILRKREILG